MRTCCETLTQPQSRLPILVAFLIIVGLYINLSKVVLETRYWILAADALVFAAACYLTLRRLYLGSSIAMVEIQVACLMLLGVIAMFSSNVPSFVIGLEGYRRVLFPMLGLFIGFAVVQRRRDMYFLLSIVAVASLPLLVYGLKQFLFFSEFDARFIGMNAAATDTWHLFGKPRAFALFNGPFHLGLFSGLVFWVSLTLYLERRRYRYGLLAALAILSCTASLTRSCLAALIVSIPVGLMAFKRRGRLKIVLASIVLLGLVAGGLRLLQTHSPATRFYVESISSLNALQQDSRLQDRYDGYRQALALMVRYPLGLGTSSAADAMGHQFESTGRTHVTSHNILLRVGLEVGWLGLLLFVLIMAQLGVAAHRLRRSGDNGLAMLAAGMLAVLVISGITGSVLGAYPVNLLFWILAGAYTRCSYGFKNRREVRHE